jgi:hypothetical protein
MIESDGATALLNQRNQDRKTVMKQIGRRNLDRFDLNLAAFSTTTDHLSTNADFSGLPVRPGQKYALFV